MAANKHNITVEQGASFRLLVTWQDSEGPLVNLTGYTGQAQVRSKYSSEDVALDFEVTLGGSAGTVLLTAEPEDTRECSLEGDKGVWDMELTAPSGDVTRLLTGTVALSREVTR